MPPNHHLISNDISNNMFVNMLENMLYPTTSRRLNLDRVVQDVSLNNLDQGNAMENRIFMPVAASNMIQQLLNQRSNSNHQALNDLLERTLYQKSEYKYILSEEGKEELKEIAFSKDLSCNDSCPISQSNFEEGELITLLPCNHAFDTTNILYWLENEKAECPVCRYELPCIEKKIEKKSEEVDANGANGANGTNGTNDIMTSRNTLNNQLNDIYSPSQNLFLNILQPLNERIMRNRELQQQQQEDEDMERALEESLRMYNENNDNDNDT